MKKTLLSLVIGLSFFFSAPGQKPGTTDSKNAEFMESIQNGSQNSITADGHHLGRVHSPINLCFSKKNEKAVMVLPASYDLRLVENGAYLSPVRDQGDAGTCWTFAAYGSIESYWRKIGMGIYDFSEQHMATCNGYDGTNDDGGSPLRAITYLSRYSGAISELDDPYTLPQNSDCIGEITPTGLITEIRWLPGKESYTYDKQLQKILANYNLFNPDIIKKAIMTYGAIDTDVLWDDFYFNTSDNTYFYNGVGSTNHEILLVGWDDNKVVTGSCLVRPKEKGAWIIRNSWGKDWGEDGYCYISYEDTRVLSEIAFYPSATEHSGLTTVFQHDDMGWCTTYGYNTETAYGLVKFTTDRAVKISSIGIPAVTEGEILQAWIYDNFNGSSTNSVLGNTTSIKAELPGIYTLALEKPVTIEANNTFYVKVKCTTTGYGYPLGAEENIEGFSSNAIIERDKYWVSRTSENGSWYQLGNDDDQQFDLCIKAYGQYITSSSNKASNLTGNTEFAAQDDIELFPTPCHNSITIQGTNLQNCTLTILSLSGQKIKTDELHETSNQVSVENIAPGVYIFQVTKNRDIVYSQKNRVN